MEAGPQPSSTRNMFHLIQYKKVVVPGKDKIALASNDAIWHK
jgi:hypothetical protein